MNLDEQFSNNVDKQMLNQLWQENVIILTQNKIQKGHLFRWPFFLPFYFNNYLSFHIQRLMYKSVNL